MVWYPRENIEECLLWRGHPAKVYQDEIPLGTWFVDESPRAGGSYYWGDDQREGLRSFEKIDEHHKARITTWLVDQRRLGNTSPTITRAIIDATKTARSLTADERAERLLGFLARQTTNLGSPVQVAIVQESYSDPSYYATAYDIAYQAMAISESAAFEELLYLLNFLDEVRWIELSNLGDGIVACTLTVVGYRQIATQEINLSSDQVFVAMWFDDSMEEAYEKGIYPAIKRTGYNPFRIDKKPDVDKIDDEIIGEIRRSRFLVADFTYGEKGIRGGVYYEAGFALGLDLEVIRSCRADQIADLHFDVNHHYHIAWNTPEELREGLERRILALVGEGPNRENIPPRNAP